MIGFEHVVGHGAEPFGMATLFQVNFDNPFESVSGRAAEKELGVQLRVTLERLKEILQLGDVVEIQTEEAAVLDDFVLFAGAESAGEGAVVESTGLEGPGPLRVPDAAEVQGAVFCVVAGDIVPGIPEVNLFVRDGVPDGGLEKGKVRLQDQRRLEEDALLLFVAEVEVKFLVEDFQQLFPGLFIEEGGEVQEGAVRYVARGVMMAGDALRKRTVYLPLFYPDVEALPGVVPGILEPAAFFPGNIHQRFPGIIGPKNMGVHVGSVMGVTDDVLFDEMTVWETHGSIGLQALAVDVFFGNGLRGVFAGRTSGSVPFTDGALPEEIALALFEMRDFPAAAPAIDGLPGWMWLEESHQILNGKDVVVIVCRAGRDSDLRLQLLNGGDERSQDFGNFFKGYSFS